MADAQDSKSCDRKVMWVRLPPAALEEMQKPKIKHKNVPEFDKVGPMRLPSLLADGRVVNFKLFTYRFGADRIYFVVERGDVRNNTNPLVRLHSACSFAHVLNSQRCDDRFQLDEAMIKIAESKAGLVIYAWPHEGRGVGMWNHTRVYVEQDKGADTVSAYQVLGLPVDSRDYADTIKILQDYKISSMRLLTNNPRKVGAFERAGITITRKPLIARLTKHNESQLAVKVEKLGHYYDLLGARDKSQVLFYEGISALKTVLLEMLDELTPGGEYQVFASGKMSSTMGSYYTLFQKQKLSREIHSKILYSESMRKRKTVLAATKGNKRFYPLSSFPSDTFIYGRDKVLIVSWKSKPPFAVPILNREAAVSYRKIFSGFWNSSLPSNSEVHT